VNYNGVPIMPAGRTTLRDISIRQPQLYSIVAVTVDCIRTKLHHKCIALAAYIRPVSRSFCDSTWKITMASCLLQAVREMITSHGKSYVIVLMSEIFPDKLRLFSQIDA